MDIKSIIFTKTINTIMTETTQIPKEKLNLFVVTGKHYLNSTKKKSKLWVAVDAILPKAIKLLTKVEKERELARVNLCKKTASKHIEYDKNGRYQFTAEDYKTLQEKLDAIDGQSNQLKLQGKSEKDILNLKVKQTEQAITAAEVNLQNAKATKDAQVKAAERNKQILQGIITFLSAPLVAVLAMIDEVGNFCSRSLLYDVRGTRYRTYGPPRRLRRTGSGSSVVLTWELPATRFDFTRVVLRRHTSKITAVTDGTSITLSGDTAITVTNSPGTPGTYYYAIFGGYTEPGNATVQYSEPINLKVTVT